MTTRTMLVLAGAALGASLGAACSHNAAPASAARPTPDSVQVGYGAQPTGKTTGAVASITEDDMKKARPMRIDELLRGKVAGLDIVQNGNAVVFRIRGSASLRQDLEPLVIVDDEQIQQGNIVNALSGLTPDDIKQVTVLKDVASTSIYGGRGAGGVILITTKGRRDDK